MIQTEVLKKGMDDSMELQVKESMTIRHLDDNSFTALILGNASYQ